MRFDIAIDVQAVNDDNMTTVSSLTTLAAVSTTTELVGCNSDYEWCAYVTRISLGQYISAMVFSSVGFPICNVFVSVLYAGVIGPRRSVIKTKQITLIFQ